MFFRQVVAPCGVKRVGSTTVIDDKSGCTVLPTMEMNSSSLLPVMIIFTGVFGAKLMKEWKNYTRSLVLFTENHWMTSETFVIYLKWLLQMYRNKTIGLIIDYAPSHDNDNLERWVKKLNAESENGSRLVIEWIDKGLTSIYQPGDIAINKPLKHHIKKAYSDHITCQVDEFAPGTKVNISRETLVDLIENAVAAINAVQGRTQSIYCSFKLCGLDPYDKELKHFRDHLDRLSEHTAYKKLQGNNQALHL